MGFPELKFNAKPLVKEISCQSCGSLISNPDGYGTEMDRAKSKDYCNYCYQRGEFIQNLTQDQMTKKTAGFIYARLKVTKEEAYAHAKKLVPTLKRWRGL